MNKLDGHRAFTSNVSVGSVSVLDLQKRALITVIPIAKKVQRISISPDGRFVFTHDQDAPRIAVIDTATNKLDHWIDLPAVCSGILHQIVIHPQCLMELLRHQGDEPQIRDLLKARR